jgi:hypothetical protein
MTGAIACRTLVWDASLAKQVKSSLFVCQASMLGAMRKRAVHVHGNASHVWNALFCCVAMCMPCGIVKQRACKITFFSNLDGWVEHARIPAGINLLGTTVSL